MINHVKLFVADVDGSRAFKSRRSSRSAIASCSSAFRESWAWADGNSVEAVCHGPVG